MNILFVFFLLISTTGVCQKVDSLLVYRWPDSRPDSNLWDKTYGWYDTARLKKAEGGLWIMDTVKRTVLFDTAVWVVTLIFPAPANCRCWGKHIFQKYLDENKQPYSPTAVLKTSSDLYYEQHHR